jgi:hypothetical protein
LLISHFPTLNHNHFRVLSQVVQQLLAITRSRARLTLTGHVPARLSEVSGNSLTGNVQPSLNFP